MSIFATRLSCLGRLALAASRRLSLSLRTAVPPVRH
jgi:hypothetical protein